MGLVQDLKAGAKAAFDALKDLAVPVAYKYFTAGVTPQFDPTTPTVIPTPDGSKNVLLAIFLEYKRRELITFKAGVPVPVEIKPTDRKVLIQASELVGIVPKVDDKMVKTGGESWRVVRAEAIPADFPVLYVFQVRRP